MNSSLPNFPVLHNLPEFAQSHAVRSSHPLSPAVLLPSIFPNIRVFSNESVLHSRLPEYWSFIISPSNKYSGLMFFRIDWFVLLFKGLSRVFSSTTVQKHTTDAYQSILKLVTYHNNNHLLILLMALGTNSA